VSCGLRETVHTFPRKQKNAKLSGHFSTSKRGQGGKVLVYANHLKFTGTDAEEAIFKGIGGWLKEQLGFGLHSRRIAMSCVAKLSAGYDLKRSAHFW
jgi:hypothetical protein